MDLPLSFAEARVLGSLLEKAISTPDYYPLTLNSLVAACNQRHNRHPVVAFDDDEVSEALDDLRGRGWVVRVDVAGARVAKFRHTIVERLELRPDETALLAELLLRGPQTIGELKGRAERLRPFASLEEVRACIDRLATEHDPALICRLDPQAGKKEPRYAHLLSGEPETVVSGEAEPPAAGGAAPVSRAALQEEIAALREETAALREQAAEQARQLESLREAFERFKAQFD